MYERESNGHMRRMTGASTCREFAQHAQSTLLRKFRKFQRLQDVERCWYTLDIEAGTTPRCTIEGAGRSNIDQILYMTDLYRLTSKLQHSLLSW